MLRVELKLDKCQGYANCVIEAPDVFDLDESEGKAVALQELVPADLAASAREAEGACPVHAITLHE